MTTIVSENGCCARTATKCCPGYATYPAALQVLAVVGLVLGLALVALPLASILLSFLICLLCGSGCNCNPCSEGCGGCGEGCGDCCSGCDCGSDGGGGGGSGSGGGGGSGSGECCDCSSSGVTFATLAAGGGLVPYALAHHPATPEYDADVYRIREVRLCIGCFTTYPVFLSTFWVLAMATPPGDPHAWILLGLGLASLQGISSAGLTNWKWSKILVKSALGLGLAVFTYGVLSTTWPAWGKWVTLLAAIVVALASAVPRARRMRRATAKEAAGHQCAQAEKETAQGVTRGRAS